MSLKCLRDSSIFILIFRFSVINSNLSVLLARIPPTFAAALTITSGLKSFMVSYVSSKLKRFVSFLVEPNTLVYLSFLISALTVELPTKPVEPKTNILI